MWPGETLDFDEVKVVLKRTESSGMVEEPITIEVRIQR